MDESYMKDNYLMHSNTAIKLYKEYAKDMPIFDYHCHLNPKEIYENKPFNNLTKVWLVSGFYGDHYKWRAMRAHGISEEFITGSKTDEEKFFAWAETVPYTIANPLYQWTHMELKTYFGINEVLDSNSAKRIYDEANEKLKILTPRKMIEMNNVKVLCTTDDPIDDLYYHQKIKEDKNFNVKVLPAFRPDKAINIELSWYNEWIDKLEKVTNRKINNIDDLLWSLKERVEYFNSLGCVVSDHALDEVVYKETTKEEVDIIFKNKRANKELTIEEVAKYKTYILIYLGKLYKKYSWVQQYHIGALRNNSQRMLKNVGPDIGFDSINDQSFAPALSKLLAKLDSDNNLPKTILYSLNPKDNEVLISLAGCFQSEIPGKIQLGSAWWFNDQKTGIIRQLDALSEMGLISHFVGMLTDSRSFMSYPRHDYFRRILCDYFGNLIENNEYPANYEFVGKIIQDICYYNAANYFGVK